mmetsp:Transcript_15752/g.25747  ORF Transcript_15752/g.25747 Transcript_15752/m.25747 type:complete len:100 (-) Transcript_15752:117-416(-)
MGTFNSLHIQITEAVFFFNSSILTVGQRTRLTIAKTGNILLIPAKPLFRFGNLSLERTMPIRPNDAPNQIIVLHIALNQPTANLQKPRIPRKTSTHSSR